MEVNRIMAIHEASEEFQAVLESIAEPVLSEIPVATSSAPLEGPPVATTSTLLEEPQAMFRTPEVTPTGKEVGTDHGVAAPELSTQLEQTQLQLEKVRSGAAMEVVFANLDAVTQKLDEQEEKNYNLRKKIRALEKEVWTLRLEAY
ncbi:hypothetical protein R1flu_020139 [Riccia fluitans]|uniref:Uncharacterized protein n=1 Tax=Riccia fluitans TaxID=41844 RepID=A0ABD1ZMU9_9MARC